jgi:uncharacterized damage-inducible protein DinB
VEFDLELSCALLERTPGVLDSLLRGLPEQWSRARASPDSWSAFDVLGHLIHGERTDWLPRLRVVLEHGTARTFEPFDREAMFEQDHDETLESLLDAFIELRQTNIASLRSLQLDQRHFKLRGMHPAFGEVTVSQLLATWVAHDMSHLSQITRTLAWQYRESVGPWREYLSILR